MNSTDERQLRRFFRAKLIPAIEQLRARGVEFFPLGPEPELDTWYQGPPTETRFTTLDVDECEAAIRELWESQDLPELAGLAGELMRLAEALEVREEQDADVSPFVYVMY